MVNKEIWPVTFIKLELAAAVHRRARYVLN